MSPPLRSLRNLQALRSWIGYLKRLLFHLSFLTAIFLETSPITVVREQACIMSIYEADVCRSEAVPEQTQEIALRRLARASTINTNTPTSVSLWDLSIPSEGEKQRITRVKLNKPSREYVKGVDHRSVVPNANFGPRGRYRCK